MKLPLRWRRLFGEVPEISPRELAAAIAAGDAPRLVDARTGWEYRQGTIAGAEFMPVTDMPGVMERQEWEPGKPVVVLCLSGHRSRPGARWLRTRSIEAYSLRGGLAAWRLAGYSFVKPDSAGEQSVP